MQHQVVHWCIHVGKDRASILKVRKKELGSHEAKREKVAGEVLLKFIESLLNEELALVRWQGGEDGVALDKFDERLGVVGAVLGLAGDLGAHGLVLRPEQRLAVLVPVVADQLGALGGRAKGARGGGALLEALVGEVLEAVEQLDGLATQQAHLPGEQVDVGALVLFVAGLVDDGAGGELEQQGHVPVFDELAVQQHEAVAAAEALLGRGQDLVDLVGVGADARLEGDGAYLGGPDHAAARANLRVVRAGIHALVHGEALGRAGGRRVAGEDLEEPPVGHVGLLGVEGLVVAPGQQLVAVGLAEHLGLGWRGGEGGRAHFHLVGVVCVDGPVDLINVVVHIEGPSRAVSPVHVADESGAHVDEMLEKLVVDARKDVLDVPAQLGASVSLRRVGLTPDREARVGVGHFPEVLSWRENGQEEQATEKEQSQWKGGRNWWWL
ncbi:hypothetical protein PG985_014787 [Apiospora marii]|uniref:uncharacterized protein n=1 Tax=Apiospora marii TaxID=335849 RepID=UPI00312F5D6E